MIKTLQYIQTRWGYFEMEAHTALEVKIMGDEAWQEGLFFGKPRYGHPEGKIILHIKEVLGNVEALRWEQSKETYEKLRLITLLHDTFKHQVDEQKPKTGENHHALIARRFAEKYTQDVAVLDIIELHDEAYHAWRAVYEYNNIEKSQKRLHSLLERLGDNVGLFYLFFVCDTQTGDKNQASLRWFEKQTGLHPVIIEKYI